MPKQFQRKQVGIEENPPVPSLTQFSVFRTEKQVMPRILVIHNAEGILCILQRDNRLTNRTTGSRPS
jgi:hypothetical protein